MYRKFIKPGIIVAIVLIVGTIGYWFIGDKQYSFLDAFYMTFITIATIGYGEIIDLSGNPWGRVFTMIITVCGLGTILYVITNLTALIVEGDLRQSFRRRKMEKMISNYENHFIVCGIGEAGFHIVNELYATKRLYVAVDTSRNHLESSLETFKDEVFIQGDATDSEVLIKSGIMKARGLFAVTADDNQNLVIIITAKQLNPSLRIVARCNQIKNSDKMRRVGANSVISPSFIGGLRMASEMIRPVTVSFLDIMLRDKEKGLRVEEISVPDSFVGKAISTLNMKKYSHSLLLAIKIKDKDGWIYNPAGDYLIQPGNTLIFMTNPEERYKLEDIFNS